MKRRRTLETLPSKAWLLLLALPGCVSPEPPIGFGDPATARDAGDEPRNTPVTPDISRHDSGVTPGRDASSSNAPQAVDASTAGTMADPAPEVLPMVDMEMQPVVDTEVPPPWAPAADDPRPLTWPPLEALVGTLDQLNESDCRVTRYAEDGVTVQAQWGYEYGPAGKLERELRSGSDAGLEVLVYDEFERLLAHCNKYECRHLEYRDRIEIGIGRCGGDPVCEGVEVGGGREVLLTRHPNPPDLEEVPPKAESNRWILVLPDGAILWQFDDDGQLLQITSREGIDGVGYCYESGRLSKAMRSDYACSDSQYWDFHPNGRLARYRSVIDETDVNDAIHDCSSEGWQLLNEFSGGCVDCALSYEGPDLNVPEGIAAEVNFGCYEGELTGPVAWDSEGNTGVWTVSDSTLGTEREWPIDRRAGRDERSHDEDGNVIRREWRHEGTSELRVETYAYEGAGPCREGQNLHLEFAWELPQHRLLRECSAKPITPELRLVYQEAVTCEPIEEREP